MARELAVTCPTIHVGRNVIIRPSRELDEDIRIGDEVVLVQIDTKTVLATATVTGIATIPLWALPVTWLNLRGEYDRTIEEHMSHLERALPTKNDLITALILHIPFQFTGSVPR